jgi:hypothetical protein
LSYFEPPVSSLRKPWAARTNEKKNHLRIMVDQIDRNVNNRTMDPSKPSRDQTPTNLMMKRTTMQKKLVRKLLIF